MCLLGTWGANGEGRQNWEHLAGEKGNRVLKQGEKKGVGSCFQLQQEASSAIPGPPGKTVGG